MERRDFLRTGVGLSLLTGVAPFWGGLDTLVANNNTQKTDLAAVRGGEPEEMFDKAMEALGGLDKFISKGQSVLVKPNIGWDAPPERAANTNPKLVGHIVKRCYEVGASEVNVFDKTCNKWDRCYSNSQIEKYVKQAGGTMVPGNTESYYKEVKVPAGKSLKSVKVHNLVQSSDVFINVPVLKHHASTKLSLGMKNLMGVIWDRKFYHSNDLHQCIADFISFRKPDLTIIDGYNMMTKNGPRGVSTADVVNLKALIASTDIVATDAAATKMFGLEPDDVGHIKIAHQMGLGNKNLQELNIHRIKI
ncbi:DUF362 domain-containing protein [Saccharicrinis fermentans]|uniref:DUF362 domain-containing protein n=1 Tax=Saccharicrinis fermentans DSM 9555 = JCM 21142 TaxID=869213 RepID=W7Y2Q3_9BACT|nr:DUF362 domain-containing protein [Saccharicrinis fermentans]GAF01848.1 hypothetical protein JCM21142_467 [Saccharicrinis fermentans DSM 9555 = JCM 21142]